MTNAISMVGPIKQHDAVQAPTGRRHSRVAAVLAALTLVVLAVGPVAAVAPSNDEPAAATPIDELPFAIDQDTTSAGVGADDVGCGAGGLDRATVWYSFTPDGDVRIEVDARPSDYLVGINLFIATASEAGRADCNNDTLAFDAAAGTTYFLAFADVNDDGIDGGALRAEVRLAPPPPAVSIAVASTASVHPKTGQARLTGTMTCDRPTFFAEISASLRLATGRFVTLGAGATSATCDATPSPWAAIVDGENGRFGAGSATFVATGLACDDTTCAEAVVDGSVKLRRGVFDLPEPPEDEGGASDKLSTATASNDDITSPTVIDSLPYSDTIDTTGATIGTTDPGYCFDSAFGQDPASVWYAYTATETGSLLATTFDSDYDTTLYVGTADGAGGIDVIGCSDDTRSLQSAVRFDAFAGETYLFAASASPFGGSTGGNLVFSLEVGPPAQAVELHVDAVGSFTGYGTATIRGSVSCEASAPSGSIVIVELNQRVGNRDLPAVAFLDVEGCPADEIAFEIELESPYGKYRGGHATAQVIYAACSPFECANQTVDLRVSLRR